MYGYIGQRQASASGGIAAAETRQHICPCLGFGVYQDPPNGLLMEPIWSLIVAILG